MTMMNRLVAVVAILCTVIAMVAFAACSQSRSSVAYCRSVPPSQGAPASRDSRYRTDTNLDECADPDKYVVQNGIPAPDAAGATIARRTNDNLRDVILDGFFVQFDPPESAETEAGAQANTPGGRFAGGRTVQTPATGSPPPTVLARSASPASSNSTVLADARDLVDGPNRASPQLDADFITRINPGEELWVIVEPQARVRPDRDDVPGCGSLVTTIPSRTGFVPIPLEHTDVHGDISGYIASVDVKQRFHNPYDTKIEAVYVFPLPENAAVRDFLMTIGSRTIRGVIRERHQAERIYEQAKAAGHVASLMTEERPNIFTQRVANIEPGVSIDVDITYFNTLAYSDGWFEFVFPMVVGPRYNPSSVSRTGDGVGAVPRGNPGVSGQEAEVAYLRPNERSGHDISVDLRIDAGVAIEDVESTTHRINVSREGANVRCVSLASSDSIPNRDLVVRYRVAGSDVKSALFTRTGDDGAGYFTMMLVPPELPSHLEREPVEFVFVLDTSGSMSGTPLDLAKSAARAGLDRLLPDDTFQIIDFSSSVSQLGSRPLRATEANIRRGKQYLDNLGPGGGTEMRLGIEASLGFPLDQGRTRFVVFLTDGFIGNENEILALIDREIGDSRIFAFGIGSSVNRHLMDEMARAGAGVVAYVGVRDRARDVMNLFFDRVSHPALCNVRVDLGSLAGAEMYPPRIPDLYVGRPVVILGRYDAARAGTRTIPVRVTGRAGARTINLTVTPESSGADRTGALEAVWARAKIASLSALALRGDRTGECADAIRSTSLAHSILSAATAFIAVDSCSVTEGAYGVTVPVPVPVPVGVEYSTTVGSTNDR